MNAMRILILIFINFIAISTSNGASVYSEDQFLRDLNSEGSSITETVDCADMNSKLSGALKWMFASNIDLKKSINVRFFISTKKQPRRVEVFTGEKLRLDQTDFNIERRTVVIAHGFLSGGSQTWIKQMEDAFHLWGDVNVVVIDWSAVGKTVNYYKAAIMTRIVGNEIAKFLQRVVDSTIKVTSPQQPKWGKLHLIGHSLGSHISGVAAYDFQKLQKNWQVSRVTGLDPALPCFENVSTEFRLDPSDAAFVDVIHTSASEKTTVGFGNSEPLGHVDFYPNGGKRQPGCSRVQGSIFNYLWIPKTPVVQGTCSHGRSYAYFTESLTQTTDGCRFWAHTWDQSYSSAVKALSADTCDKKSCTEMGIRAENYPSRGSFFLTTSKKSPFCVAKPHPNLDEIKELLQGD